MLFITRWSSVAETEALHSVCFLSVHFWWRDCYHTLCLLTLRLLMSYIYIYICIWSAYSWCFWITHDDAAHSVGLLWTSDQPVAETSAWQHTTLTTDRYPCPRWDLNPWSQQASGRRPLACWDLGFESHRGHGYLSVVSVVCCQAEVSATGWSLVQRSPTDCAASSCVIQKHQE